MILVLNAGSSSLKFAIYETNALSLLARGALTSLGSQPALSVAGPQGAALGLPAQPPPSLTNRDAAAWLLERIRRAPGLDINAAAHRIVHGGARYTEPVLVDREVREALEELVPLAPGHQPYGLAGLDAVTEIFPQLSQVACFDTAFHRTQPRVAELFPIPRALSDAGLVRYGFHGLSYEYIAGALPRIAGERADARVIVAHLGHGASLCAMQNRRSIATTMGLTALDGLMMGTRSGSVDPGLVLHLITERGMTAAEVADTLNKRSGLLGVSGLSDDVRDLEASDDARASEALALFNYRIVREIGSLMAALCGLDALVFTAGIGENSTRVRASVCSALAWTGLEFDAAANERGEACITLPRSRVAAYVIETNEEEPIARAARRLLAG